MSQSDSKRSNPAIRLASPPASRSASTPCSPILGELCGDAAVSALTVEDARPGERDRFARFEAVVHHLAEVCARTPVCVVIDDIHAADAGTVLLARFVAQSLFGRAFVLVLSRRTG